MAVFFGGFVEGFWGAGGQDEGLGEVMPARVCEDIKRERKEWKSVR